MVKAVNEFYFYRTQNLLNKPKEGSEKEKLTIHSLNNTNITLNEKNRLLILENFPV